MSSKEKTKEKFPEPKSKDSPAPQPKVDTLRELVESILIAFALAFLFKSFSAEAFVIPTGSMATTLMGRHKDVQCPRCGFNYQVGASAEEDARALEAQADAARLRQELTRLEAQLERGLVSAEEVDYVRQQYEQAQKMAEEFLVVAGRCPNCGYWALYDRRAWELRKPQARKLVPDEPADEPSYDGDRIIVVKFGRLRRWDVVVFHYPEKAQTNYIKRLVGMPGEVIRIADGDLLARPLESNDQTANPEDQFVILRKPVLKMLAMLRPVHHNDYVPTVDREGKVTIYARGWPPRWSPAPANFHRWVYDPQGNLEGWLPLQWWLRSQAAVGDDFVLHRRDLIRRNEQLWPSKFQVPGGWQAQDHYRRFQTDGTAQEEVWIRYRHFVPHSPGPLVHSRVRDQWAQLLQGKLQQPPEPQLIRDFLAYNTDTTMNHLLRWAYYGEARGGEGKKWVSDLALELELEVQKAQGYVVLELIKGGRFFQAKIDLKTGEVRLSIDQGRRLFDPGPNGKPNRHPRAQTPIRSPGSYRVMFSNIDHQLRLLVDGQEVEFDSPTTYPLLTPPGQSLASTPADYSPAGIGAGPGTQVAVQHLALYRDIYYRTSSNPSLGVPYRDFPLEEGQYFVLGDNTASSRDAREWVDPYVPEELMIGRALFIYWPHPWRSPLPWTPNFQRMKFIR